MGNLQVDFNEYSGNAQLITAAPDLLQNTEGTAIILEQYIKGIHEGVYKTAADLIPMLENILHSQKEVIKKAIS